MSTKPLLLSIAFLALFVMWRWHSVAQKPFVPIINGVVLHQGKTLSHLSLQDHNNQTFENEHLVGQWHILSYGYTHCPDVCPTTLFTMTQLQQKLITTDQSGDVQFLFYTVDPERDRVDILAQYIRYFSQDFIALRAINASAKQAFEKQLGIKAIVTPPSQENERYQVSHGLAVYIMNPEGELQAVIQPKTTELGTETLTEDVLYEHFVKVKQYYQSINSS